MIDGGEYMGGCVQKLTVCGITDALHLLHHITQHMNTARRAMPTPQDFEFAMQQDKLRTSHLEPHLKPPIPRSKTPRIPPSRPVSPSALSSSNPTDAHTIPFLDTLLGSSLSGEADKTQKRYIPQHFPPFPSKHTYKRTQSVRERERDPRRIREMATEAARQAEEALRRLVRVGREAGSGTGFGGINGKEKDGRKARGGGKVVVGLEVWERAMRDLAGKPSTNASDSKKEGDEEMEIGGLINAEQGYWRKAAGNGTRGAKQRGVA